MPSVVLIDRDGVEWEARTAMALSMMVFRDGMRPKTGSLAQNFASVSQQVPIPPQADQPLWISDRDTDAERESFVPARLAASKVVTALVDANGDVSLFVNGVEL